MKTVTLCVMLIVLAACGDDSLMPGPGVVPTESPPTATWGHRVPPVTGVTHVR